MPIYEYRCESCKRRVSVWVRRMGADAGPEFEQAMEETERGGAGGCRKGTQRLGRALAVRLEGKRLQTT